MFWNERKAALEQAQNPLSLQALFYALDSGKHLDLGSNDGRTLRGFPHERITCVELFAPSVVKLREQGFAEVHERDLREFVPEAAAGNRTWDTVTIFDVIEHLPKEDSLRLLQEVEKIADREIILLVPWETDDLIATEKFKIFREQGLALHPHGQRELHDHRSRWTPDEFKALGYDTMVLQNFHYEGFHAFFAFKYATDDHRKMILTRIKTFLGNTADEEKRASASGPKLKRMGQGCRIIQPLMLTNPQCFELGAQSVIGFGARIECITEYAGVKYEPLLTIGERTSAELFLHIGCAQRVSIGRDCIIAGHVTIADHQHGYDVMRELHGQALTVRSVEIGNHVFIGEGVVILPGVKIGDDAIIGAGSVVTHDVPRCATVVGVPARLLRQCEEPLTDIVILTKDGREQLESCLHSIANNTPERHQVYVVNNGSGELMTAWLGKLAEDGKIVHLSCPENWGFAVGTNLGLRNTSGKYVCILNDDTVVSRGWLGRMISVLRRHGKVGLVGPMSNNVSGPQQTAAAYKDAASFDAFADAWAADHAGQVTAYPRLVGFCLLMRRQVLDAVGALDTRYGLGNYDDDDYCIRAAAAGWHCAVAQDVFIHHVGQATFERLGIDFKASMEKNWQLFSQKWGISTDGSLTDAYSLKLARNDERIHLPLCTAA